MLEKTKFYSLEEIAEYFGVSYQLVYRMVRTGELPALRFGKTYRVCASDVDAYINEQEKKLREEVNASSICSRCGRKFHSSLSLTGACKECGAPLCINCVSLDHAEYCSQHDKIALEQLQPQQGERKCF